MNFLERMDAHLTAAVVSRDPQFLNYILGNTVNGTTYAGLRARTTGAPQNHWFGCAGSPLAAGIGTPEAVLTTWTCHRYGQNAFVQCFCVVRYLSYRCVVRLSMMKAQSQETGAFLLPHKSRILTRLSLTLYLANTLRFSIFLNSITLLCCAHKIKNKVNFFHFLPEQC